jgi:exodeoxyribonuclease-1
MFDDIRLGELLFRYRARNFPQSLSEQERLHWHDFCRHRLLQPEFGAPNTLAQFEQTLGQLLEQATPEQAVVLQCWREHAAQLQSRYGL